MVILFFADHHHMIDLFCKSLEKNEMYNFAETDEAGVVHSLGVHRMMAITLDILNFLFSSMHLFESHLQWRSEVLAPPGGVFLKMIIYGHFVHPFCLCSVLTRTVCHFLDTQTIN